MIIRRVETRFSKTVRSAREAAGLNQKDLARRMGWKSDSYVTMIERGDRGVLLNDVTRLAQVLKIDPVELLRDHFATFHPSVASLLRWRKTDREQPVQDDIVRRLYSLPANIRGAVESLIHELSNQFE